MIKLHCITTLNDIFQYAIYYKKMHIGYLFIDFRTDDLIITMLMFKIVKCGYQITDIINFVIDKVDNDFDKLKIEYI